MKPNGSHSVLVMDIFAGAGRFTSGFKLAGYNVVDGVEIDKWHCTTDTKMIIANTWTFPIIFLLALFVEKVPT